MPERARDTLSEKLNHLFLAVRREDGREYTYDGIERGTGKRVSRSYAWKLRHGRNNNPSLDVIEALAQFFRVEPEYFFGPSYPDEETAYTTTAGDKLWIITGADRSATTILLPADSTCRGWRQGTILQAGPGDQH